MRIGVPKEVTHAHRVAMTPIGAHELLARGHEVLVEATGLDTPVAQAHGLHAACLHEALA